MRRSAAEELISIGDRNRRFGVWFQFFVAGGWVVIVAAISFAHHPTRGHAIALIVFLAYSALGVAISWRVGLRLSATRVVVRNPIRTYRRKWADVTSFADGRYALYVGGVSSGSRPDWALLISATGRRPVTARGVGADRETRSLLTQLAASHGVPANLTGMPDGRNAKLADQIEATLAATSAALTPKELVERMGGQVQITNVEWALPDMESAGRVASVTDRSTGKRIVRWTFAPPAGSRTSGHLRDAT
jgi:hypothetical protein